MAFTVLSPTSAYHAQVQEMLKDADPALRAMILGTATQATDMNPVTDGGDWDNGDDDDDENGDPSEQHDVFNAYPGDSGADGGLLHSSSSVSSTRDAANAGFAQSRLSDKSALMLAFHDGDEAPVVPCPECLECGDNAVHYAAFCGHLPCLEVLVERADLIFLVTDSVGRCGEG